MGRRRLAVGDRESRPPKPDSAHHQRTRHIGLPLGLRPLAGPMRTEQRHVPAGPRPPALTVEGTGQDLIMVNPVRPAVFWNEADGSYKFFQRPRWALQNGDKDPKLNGGRTDLGRSSTPMAQRRREVGTPSRRIVDPGTVIFFAADTLRRARRQRSRNPPPEEAADCRARPLTEGGEPLQFVRWPKGAPTKGLQEALPDATKSKKPPFLCRMGDADPGTTR